MSAMCIRSDAPTDPIVGHDRMDACIQQRRRTPRPLPGSLPIRPGRSPPAGRSWRRARSRSAAAARSRPHGRSTIAVLVLAEDVDIDPLVPHVAEAGVEAVDEFRTGDRGIDDRPTGADPLHGGRLERHLRTPGDPDQLVEGDRSRADGTGSGSRSVITPACRWARPRAARSRQRARSAPRTGPPSRRSRGRPFLSAARPGRRTSSRSRPGSA